MVDFSVDLGGPQRGQITVKKKPADTSSSTMMAGKAKLLETFFGSFPSPEDKKELRQQKSLAGYQNELLKLGQAVEQRRMSASMARTKARALHSEFISNNPSLTEKATTLHSKTLSTAGLGEAIGKGDPVEKAEMANLEKAAELGFVFSSMTPEEQQEGYLNYMKFEAAQRAMQMEKEKLDMQSKRVGLSKSTIELNNSLNKQTAMRQLDEVAEGVRTQIRGSISDIRSRLSSSELTQEGAVQELMDRKALFLSEVNNLARAAGNENIKSVTGPIEMMFDTAIDEMSGKLKTDIAKTRLDFYQTGIQSNMLEDENMQKVYAIGKLLPNADSSMIQPHINMATNFMATNSLEPLGTPYNLWDSSKREAQKTGEMKTAIGVITDNINKHNSVDAKDKQQHKEQLNNTIMNTLRSIDIYEKAIESPKELNQIVEFIASPEYHKWTSENPVDQEIALKAAEVLKLRYEQEALPAIERLWLNPRFGGENWKVLQENIANGITMQDQIEVQVNPEGIKFVPKTDDRRLGIAARQMNKDVAPIVNKLIRSAAHLEGHTKYNEVYEKNFAKLFDPEKDLEGEQSLEDVVGKPEDKGPKAMLDLIGKAEGTDKGRGYNETLAYGKFTGGDVNLTSMTINEVLDLQSDMLKHPDNDLNSSAVGRYQIVSKTLKRLVKEMGLTGEELFDEEMQDSMAKTLLEFRGLEDYLSGKLDEEDFINNLSKEWASLPTSSGVGFYEGQRTGTDVASVVKALKANV